MKYAILSAVLWLSFASFSQVQVCLGDDATVCQGQTVTITNCTPGSGATNSQGINLNNPGVLSLSDDVWSSVIPVGFSFNFYGNTYTNCIIGSNGLISFNTSNANGYCAYALTGNGTLPSSTNIPAARNSIMLTYQDILPSINGGTIQYQTIGTAPYRKFVVLYQNVYFYNCTNVCNYMAVILNETSNEIEMYIGNKPTCGTFNGGLAIQGIQNAAGTAATITPGRNNTVWTANQDGRKFTPVSSVNTTTYTHTQVPYVQVNGTGGNIQWGNTLGATFPYNNGVLNINQIPPGNTGYFITGSACGAALGAISDTTWIHRSNVNGTASATSDFCSSSVGTATAAPTGDGPFTYLWSPSGQTTQTATNLLTGTHTCVITNANGCTKTVTVNVPNSVSTATATSTVVSCPGGNDGTATATMTPSSANMTYNWYDAGGQTTATATGLSAGTYHCQVSTSGGCIDTAEVIVTEIPGMIASIASQSNVTCNSGNDGMISVTVSQGTAPYTYAWGTGSYSTGSTANDLAVGAHTVVITDANGCTVSVSGTLTQPDPLLLTFVTPDTTICPEASIDLTATGAGGSSSYIYTWTVNGTVVGTGNTINVDPANSGTQYCVTLAEACGSPAAQQCLVINFPTEIIPNIVPDKFSDCQPATFVFSNNSNNGNEIQSTMFHFGNGMDTLVPGNGPASSTYKDAVKYSLDVIVTSIYGCVYTKSFPNLVEAIAIPTAAFTMSANPTTIFETKVQMQDASSPGVVYWEWSAPDATPHYSSVQDPVFQFPEGNVAQYPIQLVVTTPEGCSDTVTNILTVNSDIIFYAPNTFTPDGDEHNQTWKFYVDGIDIYNFEIQIFNRWGQVVWESHDPSEGWDGTYGGNLVPDGTYIWKAMIKDIYTDNKKTLNGAITLIK